jgi:hypothetical protein
VRVVVSSGQLRVSHAGRDVAIHPRCAGRFERRIDPLHFEGVIGFRSATTSASGAASTPCARVHSTSRAKEGNDCHWSDAVGALALGAIAVGALAIGRLAIGRLAIGRAKVRRGKWITC